MDADRLELEEFDRRQHRRLLNAASSPPPATEDFSISDLAFVLYDVLVDGFRPSTDVRRRQDAYRDRLAAASDRPIAVDALTSELYVLGAYASAIAIELALAEPERTLVLTELSGKGGGLLRLRRSVPSRWRTALGIAQYRAQEPEGRESFLHVGGVFVEDCSARMGPPPSNVEAVLARIALEAFYDAAAGTVNAATGWRLLP